MKVIELLDRLNHGNKLEAVAAEISVNRKKLSGTLNGIGCHYDNSAKQWLYDDVPLEVLQQSVFDHIAQTNSTSTARNSQSNNRNTTRRHKKNVPNETYNAQEGNNIMHISFTSDEISALKEFAQQLLIEKKAETRQMRIQKRIMMLPKRTKDNSNRKTVVLLDEVAREFDRFADKLPFDKSDLFQLALLDFIKKYENEDE